MRIGLTTNDHSKLEHNGARLNSIAFFTDNAMLPGLHVALLSMLESLPPNANAQIIVFVEGVSDLERQRLHQTHAIEPRGTRIQCVDYVSKSPEGANALHGNRSTYGRIYLAELLPDSEQCIYLDCDLVIRRNVLELLSRFDGKHTIYVDGQLSRQHVLEKELFELAGLDMNGQCFNAGVMALDLRLWRLRDRSTACAQAALKYSGRFKSADQALLNVVFHDDFCGVGDEINTALYPSSPALDEPGNRIYHFVGAPKPWDLFGSHLHQNYALWKEIYLRTAIGGVVPWHYASLSRTLRISRSLMKAWQAKRRS